MKAEKASRKGTREIATYRILKAPRETRMDAGISPEAIKAKKGRGATNKERDNKEVDNNKGRDKTHRNQAATPRVLTQTTKATQMVSNNRAKKAPSAGKILVAKANKGSREIVRSKIKTQTSRKIAATLANQTGRRSSPRRSGKMKIGPTTTRKRLRTHSKPRRLGRRSKSTSIPQRPFPSSAGF